MPRVKQFDYEQKRNVAVATIEESLTANNKKWSDLPKICGFSMATATNRRKNPDFFTLREIRELKLTDKQIIQLVKGKLL